MTALAPFAPGDLLASATALDESARYPTGKGRVRQFAADGTVKAEAETGHVGLVAGMALGPDGTLWATDPQARALNRWSADGQPLATPAPPRPYGSILFLPDGGWLLAEHLVGAVPGFSGEGKVDRYDPAGALVRTYDTETNGGVSGFLGVTHIALAPDGRTLWHVSETGRFVYAHDLDSDRRLGAIYEHGDPPGFVFGIHALAEGLLVATGGGVIRLDPAGKLVRRYAMPVGRGWAIFARSNTPGAVWAGDFFGGRAALLAVDGGDILDLRDLGAPKALAGLVEVPVRGNA